MDRQEFSKLEFVDLFTIKLPKGWWDGTHHGPTDPNGPIGPHRPREVSNGF